MDDVILIEGNVQFKLTIDPSVWIFDDRKISLNEYFNTENLQDHLGINFKPFIENANPNEAVNMVKIVTHADDSIEVPFEKVLHSILCFAINGKPLTTDGPVYLYFGDGSNLEQPITNIKKLYFV